MRLFVTGGAGFIGSAVVRTAIASGHTVLNVDKLTYAANVENLASVRAHSNYRFVKADICDGDRMRSLMETFRPDAVMNLAAESHVDRSIDGPADFVDTNIVGTYRLLEAARACRDCQAVGEHFRFLHVSTDEVFGSLGPVGMFDENSPYQPTSPYSATKAASDMLVRAWAETFDLPAIITNCSNNYGPYQFPEKLIPVVILSARAGRAIPIYGNGENVRDWLFVDDHARALLLAVERGTAGETYCIGGRAERTNLELVRTICSLLDTRLPPQPWGAHETLVTFVEDRPGHDRRYAIDPGKIERDLGWQPGQTLEEALASTIDWYLANDDWLQRIRDRGFDGGRMGLGVARTA